LLVNANSWIAGYSHWEPWIATGQQLQYLEAQELHNRSTTKFANLV